MTSSSYGCCLIDTDTLAEPRPHAIYVAAVVGLVPCVRPDHDSEIAENVLGESVLAEIAREIAPFTEWRSTTTPSR